MTPKEKAKELVSQFSLTTLAETGHKLLMDEVKVLAKQCALIAVDEILTRMIGSNDYSFLEKLYWAEVKQEIENL